MTSKFWIGATLVVSLCTAACGDASRGCIERVLREDDAAGHAGGGPGAVAARMRAIDTAACPEDFREAYSVHTQAWEQEAMLEPAAEAVNKPVEGFLDGVVKVMGAAAVGVADVSARKHIAETYAVVQRRALEHGAHAER